MCVGYISTSQQSANSITAGQSVGGQPLVIAGKINANSITVNNMPQTNITSDQNVSVDIVVVPHNVSRGNTIVTGTKSLPSKEGKVALVMKSVFINFFSWCAECSSIFIVTFLSIDISKL